MLEKKSISRKTFAILMESPTFVILTVLSIYPFVYTLYYSLTNFYYISKDGLDFVGLKNYADLVRNPYFIRAVINTIKFTVACTLLETVAGIAVAVYVNGLRHFKKTMRTILLLPNLLPPVTAALIWKIMLSNNYGIINEFLRFMHIPVFNWFFDTRTAMPVIILIDVWQCMPFVFLLIYASLQTVPQTLYEAAKIDGANKWHEFRYITMPCISGAVVLCLLLRTIDSFRMFDKINILTGGGPANTTATITQFIYTYGIKSLKFGYGSAGAVVMAAIVLLLSIQYIKKSMK
ncbi:carbohydrate ABC transporter permease [Enterocloster aldenensis]|uniref:carbohydrate ABC transporter permease n=1 Tax=Enterocloster aldenensis TaxID=358742 RepID=UPI004024ECFA